jgi:ATP phosphoribosyltransferase regulatory subunit
MRWLLPENIEDVLPAEAARIEALRRRVLDLFAVHGYELVIPPLLEYLESLLTGTGHDLDLRTFKLVDQLSGRMMGVRADITPQVARIDAHLLNRQGVARLCYAGSVLHARPAGLAATREPMQIGAEIYGHAGVESDLEIQRLLCRSLELAGVRGARIDVGHVAVFRSIVWAGRVGAQLESELFEALQAKDLPALGGLTRGLGRSTREALLLLPELYGGREVLELARRKLPGIPALRRALATLRALAQACSLPASFDLAELRGYHYHSGAVFDAYCESGGGTGPILVARGGRYDEVGKAFGRPRPATGFSIDLRGLAGAAAPLPERGAILAPRQPLTRGGRRAEGAKLAARIEQLRAGGETVVEELPGHARYRKELGCTRALVRRRGAWVVQPIGNKK